MKNFLALIPAKKKSSELKNKNFLKLNSIPLYQIALKASFKSKYIQDTYISSDSMEILRISNKLGAKIIIRPKKISTKNATANEVVRHFINHLEFKKIYNKEISIVYLQPTSPFRNHHHINKAIFKFIKNKFKPLVSVCVSKKPIEKSLLIKKNRILNFFKNKNSNKHTANRQNLKKVFFANGAIYIFKIKDFLTNNKIPIISSVPFQMNEASSIDIDHKFDYEIANFLSKKYIIYKN